MHQTLKQQTASPPKATMADQQRAMDAFRRDYNEVRPHEALGQTTPASHYAPSRRTMPEVLRDPEYADDFEVRRVGSNGYISWSGQRLRLTTLLADQPVGFKAADEDEWELHYGPLLLGWVHRRKGELFFEAIT